MGWVGPRIGVAALCVVGATSCRVHFDESGDASSSCTPVPGLIGYFPMESGDIVGTTLRERSGADRNAALIGGGLVTSAGRVGSALDFTATTTAYAEVTGLPFVGPAATVTLWFFRTNVDTISEDLINAPPLGTPYTLWLDHDRLCVNTENGECWGVADSTLGGRWVHAAVILRDGLETGSELYIDGAARAVGCDGTLPCVTSRTVTNPVNFGARDNYAYHGLLDDVRIYDRALTPGEITSIFDGTACSSP